MNVIHKIPVNKGWSGDTKYCAVTADGTKYLLRISPQEKGKRCADVFRIQQEIALLGIPMCRPVSIGTCKEGIYTIQTWIDGQDAEEAIPYLPDSQQYAYGLEAGRILKKIHAIPAPENQTDWETRFIEKMNRKRKQYDDCPIQFEGADNMIAYMEKNQHLLKNRPQSLQHGDYHIGNMMLENNQIVIIDFERYDYGDPWEEFNRIVWSAQKSPLFASGMVNGYFNGEVPNAFWKLLALYISSNMLSSIVWAQSFSEKEVATMLQQAKDILCWYDNMRNPIPSWYFSGYYLQYMNGLPYKLKSPFDFDFIKKYGSTFTIFDDQDSGNICFGTEKEGKRYFVKFAGAPTERYNGAPADAVKRLKATTSIYQDLHHKNLIELVQAEEVGGGYAMVFRWADGNCMGRMYPAAHRRFINLSVEDKLYVFRDILCFFEYIISQNYVAIDFYDGSILYDFNTGKTTICDIDLFRKQPCVNDMGRMWGSSKFQAPEENQLGAAIDEITNVYTIGATAFALFANYNRTLEHWQLSKNLFQVASRAISDNRECRQQSIAQFIYEWETTLCNGTHKKNS